MTCKMLNSIFYWSATSHNFLLFSFSIWELQGFRDIRDIVRGQVVFIHSSICPAAVSWDCAICWRSLKKMIKHFFLFLCNIFVGFARTLSDGWPCLNKPHTEELWVIYTLYDFLQHYVDDCVPIITISLLFHLYHSNMPTITILNLLKNAILAI